jgi:hypothetical protein
MASGLVIIFSPSGVSQTPEGDSSSAVPALPTGVTLESLVTDCTGRCHFVGDAMLSMTVRSTRILPLATVMKTVLETTPTSLDNVPEDPDLPRMDEARHFLHRCRNTDDLVEVMLRANTRERLYKNSDIIDAANGRCANDRVARWRVQYPDS